MSVRRFEHPLGLEVRFSPPCLEGHTFLPADAQHRYADMLGGSVLMRIPPPPPPLLSFRDAKRLDVYLFMPDTTFRSRYGMIYFGPPPVT